MKIRNQPGHTTRAAVYRPAPTTVESNANHHEAFPEPGSGVAMEVPRNHTACHRAYARNLALAADRARLAASALGDAPRYARNLEAAYRRMWRRYAAAD